MAVGCLCLDFIFDFFCKRKVKFVLLEIDDFVYPSVSQSRIFAFFLSPVYSVITIVIVMEKRCVQFPSTVLMNLCYQGTVQWKYNLRFKKNRIMGH